MTTKKLTYTTSYCNRGAAFTLMINDVEFRETAGKYEQLSNLSYKSIQ